MLTVVIATDEAEGILVPTLAALVPGVTAGAVREVILADAGSKDQTAEIGDIAGCEVLVLPGPVGARLRNAASAARGDWLMFLRPGIVLDPAWIGEAVRFVQAAQGDGVAAIFHRPSASLASPFTQALALLKSALFSRPHPEQGLIISKRFYESLGGHADAARDSETDLLRRLGRSRIVMLRSGLTKVSVPERT
jgi:hypothetical protein